MRRGLTFEWRAGQPIVDGDDMINADKENENRDEAHLEGQSDDDDGNYDPKESDDENTEESHDDDNDDDNDDDRNQNGLECLDI